MSRSACFCSRKAHPLIALLLLIYCFVVVGGADFIVRPWLIARGASLPYALTLLGVLGGAIAFGALGIFLGPVLLALGVAITRGIRRATARRLAATLNSDLNEILCFYIRNDIT